MLKLEMQQPALMVVPVLVEVTELAVQMDLPVVAMGTFGLGKVARMALLEDLVVMVLVVVVLLVALMLLVQMEPQVSAVAVVAVVAAKVAMKGTTPVIGAEKVGEY